MDKMLRIKTVHFGYAHVFPLSSFVKNDFRKFEELLEGNRIEIKGSDQQQQNSFLLRCMTQGHGSIPEEMPFVIKLGQVGQLDSGVNEPVYTLAIIIDEKGQQNYIGALFKHVAKIFIENFSAPGFILSKEATIRMLIGTLENKPAFQYLWEDILNQKAEVLKGVGTPIKGGGLRFVNDVEFQINPDISEIANRDFKLESYLRDPRYLFAEGVYKWPAASVYQDMALFEKAVDGICSGMHDNMNDTIKTLLDKGN